MPKTDWDSIWKERGELTNFEEKWYKLLKRFVKNKQVILEIGCGQGKGLVQFDGFLIGIDMSSAALEAARKNLKSKRYLLIKANASALPIKNESIDITFHAGLIEHFKFNKDKKIIEETERVTKSGGDIIVSVPNKYCFWAQAAKMLLTIINKYPYPDEQSYSFSELKKLFTTIKDAKNAGIQLFPPSRFGFKTKFPSFLDSSFDKIEKTFPCMKKFAYAVIIIAKKC